MPLKDAIEYRVQQAALIGWKPSRRRQIEIVAGHATLTLGWLTADGSNGLWDTDPSEPNFGSGGERISVDTKDMPKGVSVTSWTALPDTRDAIIVPTDADVREAAAMLGCRHVDKGTGTDRLIYWMVA